MKKTFAFTFTYQGKATMLVTTVTDKMEARNSWKRNYAVNYFNQVLKDQYGWKTAIKGGWLVREI